MLFVPLIGGFLALLPGLDGFGGIPAGVLFALEVNASFSNLYCYLLLVLAVVSLLVRFYFLAACFVLIGGVHGARLNFPDLQADVGGQRLKILYYNVWIHNERRVEIRDYLLRSDADLVLLTEVSESWLKDLALEERYPHSYLRPGLSADGSAIYSKYPLKNSRRIPEDGYFAALATELGENHTPLYFIHAAPPTEDFSFSKRERLLKNIRADFQSRQRTIVVGDFNTAFSSPRFSRIGEILELKTESGFSFTTWKLQALAFVGTKIDHLFHGEDVTIVSSLQGEDLGSDHYPVIWEVALK
jgi:endonuclease/exonuclease/phosphatase (EEP) superfamily protein YafD